MSFSRKTFQRIHQNQKSQNSWHYFFLKFAKSLSNTVIFSQLDVIGADPRLLGTHPRVVELQPGDVLLVPPKWWHSVQCINTENSEADRVSVSVNKWIPAEGDKFEQLKESLATFMVSA